MDQIEDSWLNQQPSTVGYHIPKKAFSPVAVLTVEKVLVRTFGVLLSLRLPLQLLLCFTAKGLSTHNIKQKKIISNQIKKVASRIKLQEHITYS